MSVLSVWIVTNRVIYKQAISDNRVTSRIRRKTTKYLEYQKLFLYFIIYLGTCYCMAANEGFFRVEKTKYETTEIWTNII